MKYKNILNVLTKICIVSLILSLILSIFNIGPKSQPLYNYVNDTNTVQTVVLCVFGCAVLLIACGIYILLTKKANMVYMVSILFLMVSILFDVVIGGQVLFLGSSIISVIVFSIYLITMKKSKL